MIGALLNVKAEEFSEDDPLLLIVPIVGDAESSVYINCGNYGFEIDTPGYLPWRGM